jgi:hypothetical protein
LPDFPEKGVKEEALVLLLWGILASLLMLITVRVAVAELLCNTTNNLRRPVQVLAHLILNARVVADVGACASAVAGLQSLLGSVLSLQKFSQGVGGNVGYAVFCLQLVPNLCPQPVLSLKFVSCRGKVARAVCSM